MEICGNLPKPPLTDKVPVSTVETSEALKRETYARSHLQLNPNFMYSSGDMCTETARNRGTQDHEQRVQARSIRMWWLWLLRLCCGCVVVVLLSSCCFVVAVVVVVVVVEWCGVEWSGVEWRVESHPRRR